MNFMRKILIATLFLVFDATAQTVVSADSVELQPLVSRDAGGFKSCGVRVVAMVVASGKGQSYDFSINTQADPLGAILKAGKYNVQLRPGQSPNFSYAVSLPAPTGFWAAAADQAVPLTLTKLTASENKGFVIGTGDFIAAVKLIFAITDGHQMQFVVQYKSESYERVITFSKQMEATNLAALHSCMEGVQKRLSASLKTNK